MQAGPLQLFLLVPLDRTAPISEALLSENAAPSFVPWQRHSAVSGHIQMLSPEYSHPARAELDMPFDTHLVILSIDEHPNWPGYAYGLIGAQDNPWRPSPSTAPRFTLFLASAPAPLTLVAWRRQVHCKKTPLYLEALWHPATRETLSIHGVERLSQPTSTAYKYACAYMAKAHKLLQKIEGRGRPQGPAGFRDEQEFLDMLVGLIRTARANGMSPTQVRIAEFLRPEIEKRQRDTGSAANADDPVDSTTRLIRKHLPCPWAEFVKNALPTPHI